MMRNRWLVLLALLLCVSCVTSTDSGGDPELPPPPGPLHPMLGEALRAPMAAVAAADTGPRLMAESAAVTPRLFVGAGDIAYCLKYTNNLYPAIYTGILLRQLIAQFPATTVFTTGDNAYMFGTNVDYDGCYDPAWGFFKEQTRPVLGNHDYWIRNGAAYYEYFGTNAGPPMRGYYSYDLGNWHVVALNSNTPTDPAQLQWLTEDLEASTKPCLAAVWHHPLFSSGQNGQNPNDLGRKTNGFWTVLLQHNADVILNGHDHDYERFAAQNASGQADPAGIVEFVVGTGGAELSNPPPPGKSILPNSQIHFASYGVLAMTLNAQSYEWKFLCVQCTNTPPILDSSTAAVPCHGATQ